MISGWTAPGFGRVLDEFRRNFDLRGEEGAAFSVYRGSEPLVELYGGYIDQERTRKWESDTIVLMFSVTKGIAAGTLALARSRGLFDYDAPVARYWPEFAQNGKGEITVRQLFGHQAGLSTLDHTIDVELLSDTDRLAAYLAEQTPLWQPGHRQGYHPLTLGLYQSELLRRTDPEGRGVGEYFREEVAAVLGLEFRIGTPPEVGMANQVELSRFDRSALLKDLWGAPKGYILASMFPDSLTSRTFRNPAMAEITDLGKPPYRQLELASANGIGRVSDVARFYSELAVGGPHLGLDDRTFQELTAPGRPPAGGATDLVLRFKPRYSLGFWKPFPQWRFGTDESAFGAPGAGGAFGFADPVHGVGVAYAPSRLGGRIWNDQREAALRKVLYTCL